MKGGAIKEERSPKKDAMLEIYVIDECTYSHPALFLS